MLAGLYLTLLATLVRRLIGARRGIRLSPDDPAAAAAPALKRNDRITNA
jgi:hypothetical protein